MIQYTTYIVNTEFECPLSPISSEGAAEKILLDDIGAEAGSDRYWAVEDAGRRIEAHRGQ